MRNYTYWLLAVVFVVAGCGTKMESKSGQSDEAALSSETTSLGQLDVASESVKADEYEVTFALKVPFGRVYQPVSKAIKWVTPLLKKQLATEGQNYYPNEVPVGQIINSDWKKILDFEVEKSESVQSGYNVTINEFVVPVWLARHSRQGNYVEANLDLKRNVTKLSSKNFGDDISFRWRPEGSSVKMEMCLNIPGSKITAPKIDVFARARKKTWYGHFSTSSNFEVNPGELQWDLGRGCFAANYFKPEGSAQSLLTFRATQAPYLQAVVYKGLSIRIGNWFLRLIDNILSIFNASIKKAVIKKVTNTVNNMADKDIESGQWFSKVYTEEVLNDLGERVHARIRRTVNRVGGLVDMDHVRNMIDDNCRLMKLSKSPQFTEKHRQFCDEVVSTLRFTVSRDFSDESSRQAGCYDYFANIHEVKDAQGNKKWWAEKCRFKVRFAIKMSSNARQYFHELRDILKNEIDELRIPERWQAMLKKYDLDEYALNFLLKELEERGISEVELDLLEDQLPELIERIKLKM